jgi:tetratricopeptide (TPR) repeat protein
VGALVSNDPARKPEVVPDVDLRKLPIGPEEAFVLSRIDGRTLEAGIIHATGLDGERVRRALDRLAHLGAIRFQSSPPQPVTPSPTPPRVSQPVISTPIVRRARSPNLDESALAEPADLDLERKRDVLGLYAELDELSHYELLDVVSTADRKTIKEAYYRAVAIFHPDKYFGKNLGSYKNKLEQIFRRLTEAHDVLTSGETRKEYDEYLVTRNRNRAFERAWFETNATSAPDDSEPPERASATSSFDSPQPVVDITGVPESSSPPPSAATGPSSRPSDPDIRRRAFARKLGAASLPPACAVSAPTSDPAAIREKVAGDLRRQHAERLAQAHQSQLRRYLGAADEALAGGNAIAAATALRIAASLAPDDTELAQRLRAAESRAASDQADSYLAQAQYEERHGKFAEAARAYERVNLGKPSPRISERLAFCLVEANGDARKALEHARRAVIMVADNAQFRITLSRAYLLAGMRQSALGEFERALELAPDDDTIKDWIRRIKRHEV